MGEPAVMQPHEIRDGDEFEYAGKRVRVEGEPEREGWGYVLRVRPVDGSADGLTGIWFDYADKLEVHRG